MKFILLSIALDINSLSYIEIEKYYWDCDTAFMKGEMAGDQMFGCMEITDTFKEQYFNSDSIKFKFYWNSTKEVEWAKRDYIRE